MKKLTDAELRGREVYWRLELRAREVMLRARMLSGAGYLGEILQRKREIEEARREHNALVAEAARRGWLMPA